MRRRRKEDFEKILVKRLRVIEKNPKFLVMEKAFDREETAVFQCLSDSSNQVFLEISKMPGGIENTLFVLKKIKGIFGVPNLGSEIVNEKNFPVAVTYKKHYCKSSCISFLEINGEEVVGFLEKLWELIKKLHERRVLLPENWKDSESLFVGYEKNSPVLLNFSSPLIPKDSSGFCFRKRIDLESFKLFVDFYKKTIPRFHHGRLSMIYSNISCEYTSIK